MTAYVVWPDEVDVATLDAVAGSKLARLVELQRVGVAVPRGFAVTVDAYRRHCAQSDLADLIEDSLVIAADDIDTAAVRIRAAFESTPISGDVREAISDAYELLSERCAAAGVCVAVRSSAIGEDSDASSFAGVFDTYLGVSGVDQVLDAVRRCWGSLFDARALSYRVQRGLTHGTLLMGVGVLELIPAEAAGVAFSVHPLTGRPDRIVVEGSFGWGEAVAQGLVTPDHVEVGKSDGRVLRYDVAMKGVVSTFDQAAGLVVEAEMPVSLRERRVLDDEQVRAVVDAVVAIERHYGHPVDIEWVLDRRRRSGEPICVVQARPITVRRSAPLSVEWDPVDAFMTYTVGEPEWRS